MHMSNLCVSPLVLILSFSLLSLSLSLFSFLGFLFLPFPLSLSLSLPFFRSSSHFIPFSFSLCSPRSPFVPSSFSCSASLPLSPTLSAPCSTLAGQNRKRNKSKEQPGAPRYSLPTRYLAPADCCRNSSAN